MNRSGEWLRIWIVLTVIWAIMVATLGWINLPRAQYIPHNPGFLNRLSDEAALIQIGSESKAKASSWGAPIWSDALISVPMPNGTRLTFPAITTEKNIAMVRDEYSRLLEAEAGAQAGPYVLKMVYIWFLPCPILLVLGLAADLICRVYRRAAQNGTPESNAAGWLKTRKVARPLRIDNPPGYEPGLRWSVAGRHAEHGF